MNDALANRVRSVCALCGDVCEKGGLWQYGLKKHELRAAAYVYTTTHAKLRLSILFCVPELGTTTLLCQLKKQKPKTVFVNKKPLTIYKWHQMITELEIGAVGTDFSRRTSWWAREVPGRANKWKSMKTDTFYNVC
jgi:hypothetical protein